MQYFFVKNITIWLQNRGGPKAAFFLFHSGKSLTQNNASQMPLSLQLAPDYFLSF